jgi:16S rRNA (guanine527-N7)-methyltransferase
MAKPIEPLDLETRSELGLLAARYALSSTPPPPPARLLEHLESEPHAPTSVRRAREAVNVHVADSLAALELPAVRDARVIADLGAGAGFPGLVLAAALPAAHVFLVESAGRKCDHARAAIGRGGLENATVVNSRAEAWEDGLLRHDLVTARALAPLAVIAEYAAPLLADGGHLVAWKGRVSDPELAAGRSAARVLGLTLEGDPISVKPYPGVDHRSLVVFSKVGPTPAKYPRRPGMAAKHPLG